ncbi:hypothetical protein [Acidiphilium angustum]|uniref:hypothetical protein n=1 Tax=Acidiphilium angustum TaxID=523 RepID=UPI0012DC5568|nr:hypothetical protein [Acidiphilium angustum]
MLYVVEVEKHRSWSAVRSKNRQHRVKIVGHNVVGVGIEKFPDCLRLIPPLSAIIAVVLMSIQTRQDILVGTTDLGRAGERNAFVPETPSTPSRWADGSIPPRADPHPWDIVVSY